jgi:hypothetical protein
MKGVLNMDFTDEWQPYFPVFQQAQIKFHPLPVESLRVKYTWLIPR